MPWLLRAFSECFLTMIRVMHRGWPRRRVHVQTTVQGYNMHDTDCLWLPWPCMPLQALKGPLAEAEHLVKKIARKRHTFPGKLKALVSGMRCREVRGVRSNLGSYGSACLLGS